MDGDRLLHGNETWVPPTAGHEIWVHPGYETSVLHSPVSPLLLLVTSSGHHWTPVQTCSLDLTEQYLVVVEGVAVSASGMFSCHIIRVFRKLTKMAIMAILASEALLCEKNPVAKC